MFLGVSLRRRANADPEGHFFFLTNKHTPPRDDRHGHGGRGLGLGRLGPWFGIAYYVRVIVGETGATLPRAPPYGLSLARCWTLVGGIWPMAYGALLASLVLFAPAPRC